MQMLRSLFFIKAQHQFEIEAVHHPGIHNGLADDLSRDKLASFCQETNSCDPKPSAIPHSIPLAVAPAPSNGLDVTKLDGTVRFFCSKGVAESTHCTYQSALCRFTNLLYIPLSCVRSNFMLLCLILGISALN
jgi:hypothetical protein